MDVLSIIEKLSEHPSPSGFEYSASKHVAEIMSQFSDDVVVDSFGNVYGFRKCGKDGAKCLLLDAHIDEIGLITTGEEDGFLKFSTLGGVDPRILPAREVEVLSNPPRRGVITVSPPHLLTAEEMENSLSIEDLYIDIGAEEKSGVPVGTPIVFASSPLRLQGGNISARALDDRASLAAILNAMERLKGKELCLDIVVLASTQEELGCRGARVAGYTVNPDWAVAVDVTHARTPDADKSSTFPAGSGVAIGVGANITKKISNALKKVAEDKKIPHTIEVCAGNSGTNAWSLQTISQGIATGLLSIPLKYMHTPCETVNKKDIEATGRLIAEFAESLSAGGGNI